MDLLQGFSRHGRFSRCGARASVVAVLGLSCPTAWGIFPDQGLNLCPLLWRADSAPRYHHGSPTGPVLQHAESSGDMGGDDDRTVMRVFLIL